MNLGRHFNAGKGRMKTRRIATHECRYLNAGQPHNPSLITLGQRKDLTMANTYTSLNYHVVFSTKDRFPWIGLEIEQEESGHLLVA